MGTEVPTGALAGTARILPTDQTIGPMPHTSTTLISHGTARRIAAERTSALELDDALYTFARTGAILPDLLDSLRGLGEDEELRHLRAYVAHHGQRPPLTGW
jgi:hypothetical protein